ncbi:phosphoadenosine phosphosulfate reductase family protein [Acidiphilium sp. PA]|uniref:phosphoadenosine phosphosulfate reductase family protein n=1 Tax=Acidiphilium sp. PA TaxID=2871705 RepID=UPI0022438F99|nr:phosphoadenosine phosphosulfate reductase family protein [Acidiphilium sp. PA]MCW8308828.1 phosphoadenosine phosphosulfate reductase family protein [Acidiphilium sp. PA]
MDLPYSASAEPGRGDSGRSALPLTKSRQGTLPLDTVANTSAGTGCDSECPPIALTPEVARLLAADAAVAIGVSGGKDSCAVAIAVDRHLEAIGHAGPRILIHADLGRVEWRDSLAACQRLAERVGWELVIVRRQAGDLLHRWNGRWANNVARYAALECVQVILPWSTPSMRFCTSEMKTRIIASALAKRFPDRPILNITGIRRQESANRRGKPISAIDTNLTTRTREVFVWNPIIEWPIEQIWRTISEAGLTHEAYAVYGSTRVSCVFCNMSSIGDLRAAASCPENHEIYRAMVDLEARSTFAFQGSRWLADTAPHLLDADMRRAVMRARLAAHERMRIEARLPRYLLYVKGWPTTVPSHEDAEMLASIRRRISTLLDIDADYLTGSAVRDRYGDLIAAKPDRPAGT